MNDKSAQKLLTWAQNAMNRINELGEWLAIERVDNRDLRRKVDDLALQLHQVAKERDKLKAKVKP